ncbi:hypothetical protein HAZT_HAZT007248 [Hyalella azteca]|uniref:Glycerate kinase n=1 Tax=Hyalella azteca TaxID=294128 RepID=A0A6A0H892_HYAAZ|nr:hypothetical protein HAZT_HAZT007248 [Hyalella azteca]
MNDVTSLLTVLRNAYLAGVASVLPEALVPKLVKRLGNNLKVGQTVHPLNSNCYIIGFGKAVINMVKPVEDILRNADGSSHLLDGVISVPYGIQNTIKDCNLLPDKSSKVRVYEGAKNNMPDEHALTATREIITLVEALKSSDLIIALISGGGSALLTLPKPPVTLEEKQNIIQTLNRAGADITELNTVRKLLSEVKGGNLALKTRARIITLILSDVINSPLGIIASGPTVPNEDTREDLTKIFSKYDIQMPPSVMQALSDYKPSCTDDFGHVSNFLMGDNNVALDAARKSIQTSLGEECCTVVVSSSLRGEASSVAETMAMLCHLILKGYDKCARENLISTPEFDEEKMSVEKRFDFQGISFAQLISSLFVSDADQLISDIGSSIVARKPCCLLFGGETTVRVVGTGIGGRNQEMVLAMMIHLHKVLHDEQLSGHVAFVSAGTDGIDGPTDAAGAGTYWTPQESYLYAHTEKASQPD